MKYLFILLFLVSSTLGFGQANYTPSKENLEAREEFRSDRFGIFIHWGIYSMLAQGEWALNTQKLDHMEYRKLASGFYPSRFNAEEWVKDIKASGAKYITITSRHHDGFSMFDTKYSDYNIVKATPFKRDILKELSDACNKYGIHLHIYYSHLDWDRDDYYPLGRTGRDAKRTTHGEWKTYYQFMNNQIRELLTNYAPVRCIWFDGWWDHDQDPDFDWQLPEQYSMIHSINSACLIGNNHHQVPFPGEDIQIFERDLPGENTAGYSGQAINGSLPLETCQTMNGMWGYKIVDQNYKSTKQLIQYLVQAAGRDANLLLNVGPQPNGELPEAAVERLKEMGKWMAQYGETIYGTRATAIKPCEWGAVTKKGNTIFVHVLDLKVNTLFVPITDKVKKARCFIDKTPVKFKQTKEGITFTFNKVPTEIDYVVALELK